MFLASVMGLIFSVASGQNGIVLTGGDSETDSFRVSYTIGQIVYESVEVDGYYFSQGLQHPLVFLYTDIPGIDKPEKELLVYPNPAGERIYLRIAGQDFSEYSYRLFDIQGRILMNEKIRNQITEISTRHINSGIYVLKVYKEMQEFTSFKVLKR